jgi:MFS family permease
MPLDSQSEKHNATGILGKSHPLIVSTAVATGLALSILCVMLDNTIIATATPTITDKFHATGDVGWYGSSYLLTTCAFQLFWGKLYSFSSIKFIYMVSFAIFQLGSLVCGAARSSAMLISGRAVAGLGAAGLLNGALQVVASVVPLKKRPLYLTLFSGIQSLGTVVGPLMGGALTDRVSWRLWYVVFCTYNSQDRDSSFMVC